MSTSNRADAHFCDGLILIGSADAEPNTAPASRKQVPDGLVDVALVDAKAIAASASMSLSALYDGVRRTAIRELLDEEIPYPQPVIRQPRYTRWRMSDVRAWLVELASAGGAAGGKRVLDQAARASSAALAKRRAANQAGA